MTNVAMLGLGAMGSRMAATLLNEGHRVVVYNSTTAHAEPLRGAGAIVVGSPREAAGMSDIIMSMVRDDDAFRALWLGDDGALFGMTEGLKVMGKRKGGADVRQKVLLEDEGIVFSPDGKISLRDYLWGVQADALAETFGGGNNEPHEKP